MENLVIILVAAVTMLTVLLVMQYYKCKEFRKIRVKEVESKTNFETLVYVKSFEHDIDGGGKIHFDADDVYACFFYSKYRASKTPPTVKLGTKYKMTLEEMEKV